MLEQDALSRRALANDANPRGEIMVGARSYERALQGWRGALACFLVVGAMAGVALWVTEALGFRPWVLFLAWVGYGLLGASLKVGCKLLAGFGVGAAAGMATFIVGEALGPWLNSFAMPLALALSCGILAALEKRPPLDVVPAYFLGMIAFFATGAEPGMPLLWSLTAAAAIGVVWGWSAAKLRGRLERRLGS